LRPEPPRREPCGCRQCKQRTCSGLRGPWPRLAVELAGLFLWSLTFEVTPPAEVGAVRLGCEHSTKYRSPALQRLP
jgi:hypothetical protein